MKFVVAKSASDPRWHFRNRPQLLVCEAVTKATVEDRAEVERLLNLETQLRPKIRQAFLDAVDRLQGQVDVERIAELLRDGRVQEAMATVDAVNVSAGFAPLTSAITGATILAANRTADSLGALDVTFGITNPRTIDFLRTYEMGLIRNMTADSLASVRTAITLGVNAGRNPLDIARDVREFIGLTPRQTQAVENYRSALEAGSSDALDRALRDRRFDPTVARAISGEADLSADQIDTMVGRYQQRYLRYRSETIARTESMRAVNAGNDQLWRQTVDNGQVQADEITRTWVVTDDNLLRHAHRLIPEMNPDGVGLHEPFDSILGPIMRPGDPNASAENTINCRCTVIFRYTPKVTRTDDMQDAA